MGSSTQLWADGIVVNYESGADLTDHQGKGVNLNGDDEAIAVAAAGQGFGILLNAPAEGERAFIVVHGEAIGKAEGSVSPGNTWKFDADGGIVAGGTGEEVMGIVIANADRANGQSVKLVIDRHTTAR